MARRYDYFEALIQMTEFTCQTARFFKKVVDEFDPGTLPDFMREIHEIEHSADQKRHEIMNTLAKEFLPPIEREDIAELASRIDDVTDSIDDVVQHLYIYDVKVLLPECGVFSEHILKCSESINAIAKEFYRFRNSKTIQKDIVYTNELESEGDRLYSTAMRKIFTSKMSDREVLIWSNLITSFENCFDYCEDVSELFGSAVMKNS